MQRCVITGPVPRIMKGEERVDACYSQQRPVTVLEQNKTKRNKTYVLLEDDSSLSG